MKCQDSKYIVWCLDEGRTGTYSWPKLNRTTCEFQCVENITTSKVYARCTAHSFTDETYGVKNLVVYYNNMITYAVDSNPRLLLIVSIVMSLMAGLVAGILTKNMKLGIMTLTMAMVIFSVIGWMFWPITVIFIILTGYMMLKMGGSDDE